MRPMLKSCLLRFFALCSLICWTRSLRSDPLYDICDSGVPDAVVTLASGRHFVFKGAHAFEIDTRRENASSARDIAEYWPRVTGPLDLAFTLMGVEWSDANDVTVFVQGNQFKAYKNFDFWSEGSTEFWFESGMEARPTEAYYDQVLYQKKDAVVSFRHRKLVQFLEAATLFDDLPMPESVQVYRVDSALHPSVRWLLESSQAVYFVPSAGDSVHLYLQSGDEGYYCFLSSVESPVSVRSWTSTAPLSP